MDCWQYLISIVPFFGGLAVIYGRIERRLTKIETDVKWLIKNSQSEEKDIS